MREPPTLDTPDFVFQLYPSVPAIVPTVVTSNVVEEVASKLSGATGPGDTSSKELKTGCCFMMSNLFIQLIKVENRTIYPISRWYSVSNSTC